MAQNKLLTQQRSSNTSSHMTSFSLSLLVATADQIVTQVQLYGMDDVINATVLYTSILEPSAGAGASFSGLQKVGTLVLTSHPVAGTEGQPFPTQPQLQVQDSSVSWCWGTGVVGSIEVWKYGGEGCVCM